MPKIDQQLLQAVAVTAELTGTQLSEAAARVFCADLARYPLTQVLPALDRCRRECRGRLTLADVMQRLDDGRPGPEEAWAAVAKLTEADTVVWTHEMQQAHATAAPLIEEGEQVAARMAFLERYRYLCQFARDNGIGVSWQASLGHDAKGREGPVMVAVEQGKLTADRARALLPWSVSPDVIHRLEAHAGKLPLLEQK